MKTKNLFLGSAGVVLSLFVTSCVTILKPDSKPVVEDSGRMVSKVESTAYTSYLISKKLMDQLEENYVEGNYAIISKSKKGIEDTKYVEYDLDVLRGYLDYVAQQAVEKNVKSPKIRIAFGQYPNTGVIDKRQKREYAAHQTVFLVPIDEENGDKTDVDSTSATKGAMRGTDGLDFGNLKPPY